MKFLVLTVALLAGAWAQSLSSEYLPPVEEASNVVETNFLENEPAHSLADDGYRYKTVRRYRFRHRRDVNELSNEYLPPVASAPEASYSSFESGPESYDVEASAPAHTFGQDGYRYKTVKRFRVRRRRRRDVNELSSEYLPPAASAPEASYSSSSFDSAPAGESYEVEASAPAHTFGQDGYRYKTVKRFRVRRRRRDVNELSSEYLPPVASAPEASFSSFESGPESYDVEASAPAHTFGQDGYRYRTVKRFRTRHRRRRDVNELSSEYLPPAASAPGPSYSSYESAPAYSAPAPSYSAPAAESYEVEASAPAHTFGQDGYRYKTVKRFRVRRRRRDVNELSSEYLPPVASAPEASFSSFESGPESYDVEASAPAHTFGQDGYRYRTVKRFRTRHRRRRDVSELSSEYLPPAASAPGPSYSSYESAPAYSAPAPSYSAPIAESYDVQASAPAHTFGQDGYRYKTVKRYRLRRRH